MIYIFHGSDSFSRREAVEALKRELDSDGQGDLVVGLERAVVEVAGADRA